MTGEFLTAELLNELFLALTPLQRWDAARGFSDGFIARHWFIIAGSTAFVVLVSLLFWVSYNRTVQQRKVAEQLFVNQAGKRGLSVRERQILLQIVKYSGLKDNIAIFTMQKAFERGTAKLIEQNSSGPESSETSDQLRAELTFLREKLGFQMPVHSAVAVSTPRKLRSMQVPVGRNIQITRRKEGGSAGSIDTVVIENSETKLVVKLKVPVQSKPQDYWRVRYYFGTSVLEFDTTTIHCNGNILALKHTDNVRFVNRRRFARVTANKSALVAQFPFAKVLSVESEKPGRTNKNDSPSLDKLFPLKAVPEFKPALITELAGPGLRIDTQLKVKTGDRLLVIFPLNGAEAETASKKASQAGKKKIVEDIGIVRHAIRKKNGTTVALELVGLSDSDVNELIRATNNASATNGTKGNGNSRQGDNKSQSQKEPAAEMVSVGELI